MRVPSLERMNGLDVRLEPLPGKDAAEGAHDHSRDGVAGGASDDETWPRAQDDRGDDLALVEGGVGCVLRPYVSSGGWQPVPRRPGRSGKGLHRS